MAFKSKKFESFPHPSIPGVAIIPLPHGLQTLIDESDLPLVKNYAWHAHHRRGYWYAAATKMVGPGRKAKRITVSMHSLIAGALPGFLTDHRNGDTLDNRRQNLRLCTRAQNKMNAVRHRNSSYRFKGVYYRGRCWFARIKVNKKLIRLGRFVSDDQAAAAYDAAAARYFGEFARVNFPPGVSS
jgi:hypothetical protein